MFALTIQSDRILFVNCCIAPDGTHYAIYCVNLKRLTNTPAEHTDFEMIGKEKKLRSSRAERRRMRNFPR